MWGRPEAANCWAILRLINFFIDLIRFCKKKIGAKICDCPFSHPFTTDPVAVSILSHFSTFTTPKIRRFRRVLWGVYIKWPVLFLLIYLTRFLSVLCWKHDNNSVFHLDRIQVNGSQRKFCIFNKVVIDFVSWSIETFNQCGWIFSDCQRPKLKWFDVVFPVYVLKTM